MNPKLTSKYRDILKIERNKILINYAKQTSEYGQMLYIYSKSSQNENKYNATFCEEGKEHEIIELSSEELPDEVEEYCVIRIKNGEYVLDEKSTNEVSEQIEKKISDILEEQKLEMQEKRIEGHVYIVNEKTYDRVWLFDITEKSNDGIEEIEELEMPTELLEIITPGDKIIYENEKYNKYE